MIIPWGSWQRWPNKSCLGGLANNNHAGPALHNGPADFGALLPLVIRKRTKTSCLSCCSTSFITWCFTWSGMDYEKGTRRDNKRLVSIIYRQNSQQSFGGPGPPNFSRNLDPLPSGQRLHSYGKIHKVFFLGKWTFSMAIFNSKLYFFLPESRSWFWENQNGLVLTALQQNRKVPGRSSGIPTWP